MNAFLRKGIAIALLCLFQNQKSIGQLNPGKFELGLTGGTFIYQGDLTPARFGSYRTLRPTINLFLNRILSPAFSLRTSLFYGGLRGNDAAYAQPEWRKQRSFSFNTPVLEVSELLVWNAWSTDRKFVPYVFGGIGLSFVNIKRDWSRFNGEFFSTEDLLPRLTEDIGHKPPKLIPVVPFGMGIQYSLTNRFSLIAETSYRFTQTDYLDGFSKAGNPGFNDHYQSHTIGLLYKFGKKSGTDCPTVIQ